MTLLGGCAGQIYEWEAQTRSVSIPPAISPLVLGREAVAVLAALTPVGPKGKPAVFDTDLPQDDAVK
jgi:hypothetical protein